jgi:hypothetical protein
MRLALSTDDGADDLLTVDIAQLASLAAEQRLAVAKAFVAAAFAVCPKHSERDDLIPSAAFELAGHLNGAVQALLQTAVEHRRAEYFAAIREHDAHVVH